MSTDTTQATSLRVMIFLLRPFCDLDALYGRNSKFIQGGGKLQISKKNLKKLPEFHIHRFP